VSSCVSFMGILGIDDKIRSRNVNRSGRFLGGRYIESSSSMLMSNANKLSKREVISVMQGG